MLTETDKAMLDVAAGSYKYAGSVDVIVGERFGLSPTRFWQSVNQILGSSDAALYRPEAVRLLTARKRPQRRLHQRILTDDQTRLTCHLSSQRT